MRKKGNYRTADDISRCANCKHHYKVSRKSKKILDKFLGLIILSAE